MILRNKTHSLIITNRGTHTLNFLREKITIMFLIFIAMFFSDRPKIRLKIGSNHSNVSPNFVGFLKDHFLDLNFVNCTVGRFDCLVETLQKYLIVSFFALQNLFFVISYRVRALYPIQWHRFCEINTRAMDSNASAGFLCFPNVLTSTIRLHVLKHLNLAATWQLTK